MNKILPFTVVGTSHIAQSSVYEIKQTFLEFKPDMICVELDQGRAKALMNPDQPKPRARDIITKVGVKGFLFVIIGRKVQQKLGKIVGVDPGGEMKFAMELAKNNMLELHLVDKPIEKTVKKLFKKITFKEKMRFVGQLIVVPFISKKKKRKHGMSIPLTSVPDEKMIEKMMKLLKKQFPSVYKVLVKERNEYMARKIALLLKKNSDKKILVVVGAGHKKEIERLIPTYYRNMELV